MTYEIMHFNELTVDELYSMMQLREEVFIVEQDCVYLDCDGYDPKCHHFIAKVIEDDESEKPSLDVPYDAVLDNVVATLRIMPAGSKYDQVSIGRVVVAKSHRGQGIADDMMAMTMEFIKENYGDVEVVLSAQVAIKDLYERAGFEVISDVYLEDGIDHVKMKRQA